MEEIRNNGIKNVHFNNWARTFSCTPKLFFAPKTEDEIKQILQLARDENQNVRVVGCGHSPSNIACTDGFMISLQNFNQIISVNKDSKQVKVQAGITIKELNEIHLPSHGLALSVLGSISEITVGGAISTGTHGTGIKYGLLSTYVTELEILTSSGTVIKCSPQQNEDVFLAAACNLGSMGVILTATLQCEAAFNLLQNQYPTDLREVIEHLDIHLQASDHFRFMWFPYTDGVVAYHCSRTDKPVTKKSWWTFIFRRFWDYAIGYYALEFFYYISVFFPDLVPIINRVYYNVVFSRCTKTVDVSHKVFNFECLFKQHVTEWAISKDRTGEVIWKLREWIETNPDVFVHFPIEVRFVKADNILISPAYGRDTCYINIIMYRPYNVDVPYQKYWSAYESIMEDAGGRPHWAKAHNITASTFQLMYPGFDRWCMIRRQLDPINMFYNPYMTKIFES